MKLSRESLIGLIRSSFLILLLISLPSVASGQKKSGGGSAPAPAPHAAPAPAPHAAAAPHPSGGGAAGGHPGGAAGGAGANNRTATGAGANNRTAAGANNRAGTGAGANNKTATGTTGANRTATGTTGANKTTTGTTGTNRTTTGTNRTTTGTTGTNRTGTGTTGANAKTTTGVGTNAKNANTTGAGNKAGGAGAKGAATGGAGAGKVATTGGAGAGKGAATGAGAGKGAAGGAAKGNNTPGTHTLANGGTKTVRPNGSAVEKNKSGKVTGVTTSKGTTAKMDAHGRATHITNAKGTNINRGPNGGRRVESARANHGRVVSNGKRGGFSERRFNRGGREYARRSYYRNGRYYGRVYRPYYYGGYGYYGYVSPYYYGPAYYGWAYNPWPAPVYYSWGWGGAPWYQPYGYYFQPYPYYPSPAWWITDFVVAASLQAAAEAAAEGNNMNGEPGFVYASAHLQAKKDDGKSAVLTKELKDAIAEQVKLIIADEKAEAAAQGTAAADPGKDHVPPSLDPRFTLFMAQSDLSLDTDDGACALTPGDVVRRTEDTPDADTMVAVEVVSSKKDDCAIGTASKMKVDDVEEMHDSFRQQVDDGLKSLAENKGKGGIPNGPDATTKAVPEGQTAPDLTVADDLKQAEAEADETEKDVQDASSDSGSAD